MTNHSSRALDPVRAWTGGTSSNGATSRPGGHSSGHSDGLKASRDGSVLYQLLARFAKFLGKMMLAVRQGFEPWVQVLARTTV
jgi:hypothetical protein